MLTIQHLCIDPQFSEMGGGGGGGELMVHDHGGVPPTMQLLIAFVANNNRPDHALFVSFRRSQCQKFTRSHLG